MKKTMGETIAQLRKNKGMTQAELAEQMNVTDKAVSKWERDISCPEIGSLPKLAEIFEVSVDELMRAKTEGKPKGTAMPQISLVLKAVGLAMGVAVAVLSVTGNIDNTSAFVMLGIGVACLGLERLSEK